MGRAVALCLAVLDIDCAIRLVDTCESAAEKIACELTQNNFQNVTVNVFDRRRAGDMRRLLFGADVCVATCGYEQYVELTRACIAERVHMVDLGGNRDVVSAQKEHHREAELAGVAIAPDCGLAPGLINILAVRAHNDVKHLGKTNVKMYVGGLPAKPGTVEENPLQYKLTWSAQGLINEYLHNCEVVLDEKLTTVPALSQRECMWINGQEFEAFATSGGSSNVPSLLKDEAHSVIYKTLRYPGHLNCVLVLRSLGLFEYPTREILEKCIEQSIGEPGCDDIVVAQAIATSCDSTAQYELVCKNDRGLTAMAQTTGFSAAVVAVLMTTPAFHDRGILCVESVIGMDDIKFSNFTTLLKRAGLKIEKKSTGLK